MEAHCSVKKKNEWKFIFFLKVLANGYNVEEILSGKQHKKL